MPTAKKQSVSLNTRLQELKKLHGSRLITKDEFNQKKAEMLKELQVQISFFRPFFYSSNYAVGRRSVWLIKHPLNWTQQKKDFNNALTKRERRHFFNLTKRFRCRLVPGSRSRLYITIDTFVRTFRQQNHSRVVPLWSTDRIGQGGVSKENEGKQGFQSEDLD